MSRYYDIPSTYRHRDKEGGELITAPRLPLCCPCFWCACGYFCVIATGEADLPPLLREVSRRGGGI